MDETQVESQPEPLVIQSVSPAQAVPILQRKYTQVQYCRHKDIEEIRIKTSRLRKFLPIEETAIVVFWTQLHILLVFCPSSASFEDPLTLHDARKNSVDLINQVLTDTTAPKNLQSIQRLAAHLHPFKFLAIFEALRLARQAGYPTNAQIHSVLQDILEIDRNKYVILQNVFPPYGQPMLSDFLKLPQSHPMNIVIEASKYVAQTVFQEACVRHFNPEVNIEVRHTDSRLEKRKQYDYERGPRGPYSAYSPKRMRRSTFTRHFSPSPPLPSTPVNSSTTVFPQISPSTTNRDRDLITLTTSHVTTGRNYALDNVTIVNINEEDQLFLTESRYQASTPACLTYTSTLQALPNLQPMPVESLTKKRKASPKKIINSMLSGDFAVATQETHETTSEFSQGTIHYYPMQSLPPDQQEQNQESSDFQESTQPEDQPGTSQETSETQLHNYLQYSLPSPTPSTLEILTPLGTPYPYTPNFDPKDL